MDPVWSAADEVGCGRFAGTLELVGKRWAPGILLALSRGATRFGEIRAVVPGLSDRLLAQRLRELEAKDLINRTVVATMPVGIRYELTERGIDLMSALHPLLDYGSRWDGARAGRRDDATTRRPS